MSFSPPATPGPNPYVGPPTPPSGRPKWTRKRVLLPVVAVLFFLGVAIGGADGNADSRTENTADAKPGPAATVTATATATPEPVVTVTADPEPAPTVTETKTVRVTVAPAANKPDKSDNGGSSGSGGSDTGGSGGGSTYYANCTAVRAAGADPIRSGDPGYGSHLDRDGDGIACE